MIPRWSPPVLARGNPIVSVTPRQADVLTGMCFGLTAAQIGRRLGVSEQTTKSHAKRLYRAMGARDRAHAVALAVSGQMTVAVRGYYDPEKRAA